MTTYELLQNVMKAAHAFELAELRRIVNPTPDTTLTAENAHLALMEAEAAWRADK